MTDFLSFFRFLLPGTIYLALLLISYLLYNPEASYEQLEKNSQILDNLVGALLISGAFGYIFSLTYRIVCPIQMLNHVDVVNYLLQNGIIIVEQSDNTKLDKIRDQSQANRIKAYDILNIVWHLNHHRFDKQKSDFHSNLLNSMGSTLSAIFFCLVTYLLTFGYISESESACQHFIPLAFILGSFGLVLFQHTRSRKTYERWIASTLISQVKQIKLENKNRPIIIPYFKVN